MASKTDFKGYKQRFEKGGDLVKEQISEHACPDCGDGTRGIYTQQWRSGGEGDRTLYHIEGQCPKGHTVDRYGFGEAVK
jgi:DNA-directed RNA polymerase subunit M/transcription elongation factor TFIIS